MGVVYTWHEISHGLIPKLSDFTAVEAEIRRVCSKSSAIVAGLICGSVLRGDATARSDIDCIAIISDEERAVARQQLSTLHQFAKAHHVKLNLMVCQASVAATDMHHLGPSFMRHVMLSAEQGGSIKGDVAALIGTSLSPAEDAKAYLRFKHASLEEHAVEYPAMSDVDQARFLKKVLESPTHIVRKMLVYWDAPHGDSKADVHSAYLAASTRYGNDLGERYDELLALDRWYTDSVVGARDSIAQGCYQGALCRLREATPRALEFATRNLLLAAAAAD